jgi:hypothetical protein
MPYIGKPQSADPITVNTSNIDDGTIQAVDISSSFREHISGSITESSSSFSTRITTTEASGALLDGDGSVTFGSVAINTTSTDAKLVITATEDSSTASPVVELKRNSSSPADADYMGRFLFKGENDADQEITYARLSGKIQDASDGSEDGIIEFSNMKAGSQTITARLRSDSLQLLNSTNLSVAGTTTLTGNVTTEADLTVAGTLTAQEIHTEFTSASILFTSGSTIFGNSSDDVHNMTGSLNISGSLFVKDGTLTVTDNVDFNGDLDVDGTTNLDNTDIDGTLTVDGGNIVFNEDSADQDFRVESNGNANMFFVDGGQNRVGIGEGAPGSPLDVKSTENANTANFNSTVGATNITFESNGSLIGQMEFSGPGPSQIVTRTTASLALGSNNVQTLFITDADDVGIGTNNPDGKLHIHDGSAGSVTANGDAANLVIESSATGADTGLSILSKNTRANQIFFGDEDDNDIGAIGYVHNGNYMFFRTNTSERMRIASDGKVFIGSTSSRSLSGVTPQVQVEGLDYGTSSMSLIGNTGTDAGTCPLLMFGRSRGTSDGTSTAVASGDRLGAIFFTGADGTDINTVGAYIESRVDGSVSGNVMPGRLQFYTNSGGGSASEKMRIDKDGHVEITDGNLIIGTSGHGIDFSATSNATGMSSELLDDYEEGVYDITIGGLGGGSLTMSSVKQQFSYTKIGRQVTVQGEISITAVSSLSGTMTINLPFSVGSTIGDLSSRAVGSFSSQNHNFNDFGLTIHSHTYEGQSVMFFVYHKDNGGWEYVNTNTLASNTEFRVSLTYFTN